MNNEPQCFSYNKLKLKHFVRANGFVQQCQSELFCSGVRMARFKSSLAARPVDAWLAPLQRVRGHVGDDDIERITTQLLFDILEVAQRNRGAAACRRLAKLMAELGWTAVRVRGLTRGG